MSEPQPEQTTPEPTSAPEAEAVDPATADMIKQQWDDSLWHPSPTPRYRP
jgi:hypothetical protein